MNIAQWDEDSIVNINPEDRVTTGHTEHRKMLAGHSVVRIGKDVFITFWKDELLPGGGSQPVIQLMRLGAFRTYHADKMAVMQNGDGETKRIPVTTLFLRDAKRYDGLVYAPNKPTTVGHDLNMWRGFAVKPVKGAWPLMQEHIKDVLAGGDGDQARYILHWTAWAIQNPGKQAEVALVIQGKKGTGKGTFGQALCRIFGAHGLQVSSSEDIMGKHNKHLQHCSMLHSDEAYWAKNHRDEAQLKRLITEPTLIIQPKGIDSYKVDNCLHILITGNNEHLVPATDDERRFAVLDMSNHRQGDVEYFKALNKEIDTGGLEAMLYDMMHIPLGSWHPRYNVPESRGLQQQKLNTITGVDALIEFLCHEGHLPCQSPRYPHRAALNGIEFGGGLLRWCQQNNISGMRYMRPTKFAKDLTDEWGCVDCKVGRGNGLEFPPLPQLRQRFETKYKLTNPQWRLASISEWQNKQYNPAEHWNGSSWGSNPGDC